MNKWDKIFLLILVLSVLAVATATTYKFLLEKNYNFVVEAPCDSSTNACFIRSCFNSDDCPPNGLENYRIFNVKASDFEKCTNNSCLNECLSGKISCKETKCGNSEEDECSSI